jgi:MFS family permease
VVRLVVGLGIGQIISWGALIYAIAVLGNAMAADLGVSRTLVFGAFSVSLVVSGLVGPRVGALIDRRGGRWVLAWGAAGAAVSLGAVAIAASPLAFVLAWALVGIARAMTLYEAAFATLSQHSGASFRRVVTAVTLFGGFAGTFAFPLCLLGLETFGWRATIAGFAAAELLICLPLHWWCIPAGPGNRDREQSAAPTQSARSPRTRIIPGFYALATSFALSAFITSAIAVHVVNLLQASGLALAAAVAVASLIGPMQVAGRLAELAAGRTLSPVATGVLTLLLLTLSLVTLWLGGSTLALAVAFAAMYGCANGIQTIVRGTVPAELFGRDGYGVLMGRLSISSFIARAIAPVALSSIAALGLGFDPSVPLLAGVALLALVAYVIAIRGTGRWRRAGPAQQ